MGNFRGPTSGQGSQTATSTTKKGRATARDAGASGEKGDEKGSHAGGDILRATLSPLKSKSKRNKKPKSKSTMAPAEFLRQAEELLSMGRPSEALQTAAIALAGIQPHGSAPTLASLRPFNLIALIYIELGETDLARDYFLKATELDPNGSVPESEGGGPQKFLWLAQLSKEGGHDSVAWFQRGAAILRNAIPALGNGEAGMHNSTELAAVLCSICEIYMTDLSWEEDAETKCETHITEALLVAPHWPDPLQTLASIRISQNRIGEAKKALMDSIELWKDLPPEGPGVTPDFPTRISLARLLMEVEAEEEALAVVKRLIQEDDQSVEAWYLGGWCLYLIGEKRKKVAEDAVMHDETQEQEMEEAYYQSSLLGSRHWLKQCLILYQRVNYEDVKLREHTLELVAELDKALADSSSDGVYEMSGEDEDDEDDDNSRDQDEEMGEN